MAIKNVYFFMIFVYRSVMPDNFLYQMISTYKFFCHMARIFFCHVSQNAFQIYKYNFIFSAYHRHIRPPPQAIKELTKHSIMLEEMAAPKCRKNGKKIQEIHIKQAKLYLCLIQRSKLFFQGNFMFMA